MFVSMKSKQLQTFTEPGCRFHWKAVLKPDCPPVNQAASRTFVLKGVDFTHAEYPEKNKGSMIAPVILLLQFIAAFSYLFFKLQAHAIKKTIPSQQVASEYRPKCDPKCAYTEGRKCA